MSVLITDEDEGEKMSKLNIELLKKVRDKIATTPEAYDQEVYGRPSDLAPCGTAACIAGWTCVLAGEIPIEQVRKVNSVAYAADKKIIGPMFEFVSDTAARLLGLTAQEAEVLFTSEPQGETADWDDEPEGAWPAPFRGEWAEASRSERPQIAVRYLDNIIATGDVLAEGRE